MDLKISLRQDKNREVYLDMDTVGSLSDMNTYTGMENKYTPIGSSVKKIKNKESHFNIPFCLCSIEDINYMNLYIYFKWYCCYNNNFIK